MSNEQTYSMPEKEPINIHLLMSQAYFVYFLAFVLGLIVETFLKIKIGGLLLNQIGLIVIVLATLIMYWAQTVNKTPRYKEDGTKDFSRGPYKYSRNPTQTGLFLLVLGAGFMINSYSVIIFAILALVFSIMTVIPKEEKRHIRKYKEAYIGYMKKTRRII